ncbi:endonuclease [Maridesulfovibrio salexigens]|uniref:Deoxyribonuclease I n=1 Tax=Maridesulfovibrio salexigens (strain ATCC 14822 / DSM 2638 / NCIMB 8403 / VKM B-1763) TaxID=526222 RepID=C6BRN1_MARSD|nr:endonuclease [Maridesulfovibrio salexigens]ACS79471.1 Deoxyribonuclease I [Maridesulfovibrio salexigens DSM 2638]
MKIKSFISALLIFLLIPIICCAGSSNNHRGNTLIQSFNKSKKLLEQQVYFDHRETIYCGAKFDSKKLVTPPAGFTTSTYQKRAKKIEWEHVVPAENFGHTFTEWREGDARCVDKRGKSFKGRKCAEKTNTEYRYMQSDLYNLYPAIGAVNAMRQNYNFTLLPDEESDFGSCSMKIDNRKAEPPVNSRGRIARTYKYMEWAYPRYKMNKAQRKLMDAWDKMYPTSEWECVRAKRIEKIQGNVNPFVVCE